MFRFTRQMGKNKLIGVSLLLVFLSVMFFSLFHMSHGMNVSSGVTDCPFMSSEGVICSMDLGEHLEAWKSFSLAAPIVILLFLLVSFVRTLYISCAHLFSQFRSVWEILLTQIQKRNLVYIPIPNHLQEAFASGILHPKLF